MKIQTTADLGGSGGGPGPDSPGAGESGRPDSPRRWNPGHYILPIELSQDEVVSILADPENRIRGVQVGVKWSVLEPAKDQYDFSMIEHYLDVVRPYGKQIFLQLMDRTFRRETPVPDYLLSSEYGGGREPWKNRPGYVARFWDPAVLNRFNKLVAKLGERFDSDPNFEGIIFPESALDVDHPAVGLSKQSALAAMKSRIKTAVSAFPQAVVIQYVNYPSDGLAEIIEYCYQVGAGIGGPDLVPDEGRTGARIPAYAYYSNYAGKMPLASAVQPPNLIKNSPKGNFTMDGFWRMGLDTLRLNYIFWGGVKGSRYQFQFITDILPYIRAQGFQINKAYPENIMAR